MFESIQSKARAKDGCAIAYRVYPQPGKPRMVLIHSLALDFDIWTGVVNELGGDVEILAYDCRGHGKSERRAGTYTEQLFAHDLAAVLDDAQWDSAFVAGCSMGGCVAQAFAAEYPARTLGLGLIDTTAWYGPTAKEDWRKRAEKAAEDGFAAMLPFQLTRWFSDAYLAARPPEIDEATRVFLANDMACYQASCGLLGSADLRSAISVVARACDGDRGRGRLRYAAGDGAADSRTDRGFDTRGHSRRPSSNAGRMSRAGCCAAGRFGREIGVARR